MFVSIGNSRMDKKFNCTDMTYEDFVSRLSKTKYTAETMEQYRKMPKGQQDNIKDVGGFVLGKLKGGRRKKDCVISRSAITLDMDYGTQGIIDELEMFFDMKMVVYSTHKHTPEKPRLRIIIFLTRDVTPDEYGAVSRMLASDIGIELFDDSTYEPSRLMYWPSTSSDGEYVFQEIEGNEVDPDEVLSRYKDWHDVSAWPVSNRQASVVQRDIKKQADPLSKDGLIGAFNRTYTVTQAIDKFIPDVYRHSRAIPGRYDYIPADSAAGVVVYDDLFVYSHHATDPCCGKLMNAFDVVRLHKFGDKDARAAEGTEPGKLPSFKAMQDFASADEEVKNTLAKERQELAVQEFSTEPDEDWQNKLALDRRGNIKDAVNAAALSNKLQQMANGAVYDESGNVRNIHDRKLDALEDLIESANGKPLLVAYWFKHDRERILKRFPARDINTKKDIEDWNEGKISVALIHPASAGHGLNLQEGGSTIVWFSLTWSLELYQQLNARLYRQGQKHTVVIEHLVTEGTVDEDILRAIGKKDTTQNAMIEAVKARIGGMTDDGRSNDEGI